MSTLTYKHIMLLEELKKYNLRKSPLIYLFENNLINLDKNLIFSIKNDPKLLLNITKIYKNNKFILYKSNHSLKKKNILNIKTFKNINILIDNFIGLLVIDLENYYDTKILLNEFLNFINNDTVIYMPYLVNFDNFYIKSIRAVFEFCDENNFSIEWIGINGNIKLYDFFNYGFNNGVAFRLIK